SNWIEVDSAGAGPDAGNVRIFSNLGDNRLRLRGPAQEIRRSFDGTTWDEAILNYDFRRDGFEADDYVSFQISTTGGLSWIEIDRFIGPGTDSAFVNSQYDLTRFLGQSIDLRWLTSPGFDAGSDTFYFDSINIDLTNRISEAVAGNAPPALYSGGDLLTGESFTVTVEVTLDAGIDPTTQSITNTATTSSTQSPTPVSSSFTDQIARASVGDTVWHDLDGDGVVDAGESRLSGVTVSLSGGGLGAPVTTVTDVNGNYLFENLDPDSYTVSVTAGVPAGMAQTFDIDGGFDSTSDVTLGFGEDNVTTNFGYATPVSLGDSVYADLDGDGTEEAGEFGIDALTVTITGPSHPTGTSTTTNNGFYEFTNLLPGTYTVDVDTSPLSPTAFSTTGGDSQMLALTSGTDVDTVDFGYVLPGMIGDRIWHDLNADGVQDAGEPNLSGVEVSLNGPGLPFGGLTETTDSSGFYIFSNLPAGTFDVDVTLGSGDLPAGYLSSTGGASTTVTITADQILDTIDFGFYDLATIGDFVFDDLNGDGDWDAGEPGISGVDVTITGGDIVGSITATTTATGDYDFAALTPGTYAIVVDESGFPAGTLNTLDGANPSVTVESGQDFNLADFGYLFPATVGDFVFDDLNADGSWDTGEPGLDGVLITLTGGNLPVAGITDTTAGGGAYLFSGLEPGDYTATLDVSTLPAGYTLTTTTNTASANIWDASLVSGSNELSADYGATAPADIGDFIWHDLNGDGVQDVGEPPLAGVDVALTGGDVIGSLTDTTDASGNYLFAGHAPGIYTVTVNTATVPAGYNVTSGDDTRTTTLESNIDALDLDLGYASTASIGDFVWEDVNGGGVQDGGEPGIAGVDVTITGTSAGASHPAGNTVATDASGGYDFAGLEPGDYTITLDTADLPAGAVNSFGGASQNVTVISEQDSNDIDFGYYVPASIGDRVWEDSDGDGIQNDGSSGYVGITVSLSGGPTVLPPQTTGIDG
ncbi:MAG: carboxypeptidase regulatory-like domain-containing protein, partial [Ilumatobacteraceae bacterium]|nr:carboxypeptidase regulatory-like domain-containing protein [Ilumatobacteraceae bacterium]